MSLKPEDLKRVGLILDEIAEHCGMISLHAGLARDHAIAADPIAIKYSLRRLSAYLRASTGLLSDLEGIVFVKEQEPEAEGDFWT